MGKLNRRVKTNKLFDVEVNEVSLVDKPANLKPFLLYKRDGGLDMKIDEKEEKKEVEKKEEEKKEEIKVIEKKDMDEDALAKEFLDTIEVIKTGKKISKKNVDLIKNAISTLQAILTELEDVKVEETKKVEEKQEEKKEVEKKEEKVEDKKEEKVEDSLLKEYNEMTEEKKKEVDNLIIGLSAKIDTLTASK
jgi:signal recognition particle GTPase